MFVYLHWWEVMLVEAMRLSLTVAAAGIGGTFYLLWRNGRG